MCVCRLFSVPSALLMVITGMETLDMRTAPITPLKDGLHSVSICYIYVYRGFYMEVKTCCHEPEIRHLVGQLLERNVLRL